jgi:hypothetical protein
MTGQRGPPVPSRKTNVLSRVPSRIATMAWKARAPAQSSTTFIGLTSLLRFAVRLDRPLVIKLCDSNTDMLRSRVWPVAAGEHLERLALHGPMPQRLGAN